MSVDAPNGLKARRARLILAAVVIAVAALLVAGGFTAATLMRDDTKGQPQAAASPSVGAPASASTGTSGPMTPEKGKKTTLRKPTGQKDGVSTGFPGTPSGGISAVVYFWEEYAWLDDEKARQQLTAVASKDSPGYVDKRVSEIRKMREALGLPPSGGISADINFTTAVNATRATTVHAPGLPVGDVMQVWVSYDRFGTGPKGGRDENPLRGDMVDFIVKWQDGAWRFTDEFDSLRSFPVAYEPTSRFAWNDGWVQVRHVD
ncbi:hypothetical protein [Streptomyces goshikiensis]|uniref:hypothetical protein n=1 Tax=Streptomyces goshikiensis TaxID=1942 RepID=UPI0022F38003|nr:hypothetical protein [Streptomyces goshikiensis]WBY25054.1 hypothetical protein PET44_35545 [Streptomyces goshikiensis]